MKRLLQTTALALTLTGCAISTQQEVQMGADYAQQINAQLPIVQDAEVNRYLNVLGDSIARLADGRGLQYRFFMVNAREVNAFAVPGGFIYVNRGLVERTQNLSQFAGVLGHEIGHIVRRHSVQQMQKAQGANVGIMLGCVLTSICGSDLGRAAIEVGGTAAFAKFSRDDEREADAVAIQYLAQARIHPRGVPEMFDILLAEAQRSPSTVEGWFSTHPGAEERAQRTRQLIAQLPANQLAGMTVDSPAFQSFKRRVQSLPAPPQQQQQRR
jgi:beta-barrel assembly-enhancing protease